MIASSTDVVLMEKELEKNGQKVQVFLPPWPLTLDLLQNGGKAMEGTVAISIADLEFRTPAGKAFEAAYKTEFGELPSFTAMFAYETASILRSALSLAPGAGPAELRKRIIATGEFKGLQGTIRFNDNAESERDMFLFTIKNGTFERVD
jgi:branched-chain amino acid transport system substrate-binding protein